MMKIKIVKKILIKIKKSKKLSITVSMNLLIILVLEVSDRINVYNEILQSLRK